MSDQAAVSEPKAPPTSEQADSIHRFVARNPAVSIYVRLKEAEADRLWQLIRDIASQPDPAWGRELARRAIAEREA